MCGPGQSPALPATAGEALGAISAGLRYLNQVDAAGLTSAEQAECLRGLAAAEAMHTAARSKVLAAFSAAGGCEDDGHGTTRTWLRWQTRITPGAAGAAVGWARRLGPGARDHVPHRLVYRRVRGQPGAQVEELADARSRCAGCRGADELPVVPDQLRQRGVQSLRDHSGEHAKLGGHVHGIGPAPENADDLPSTDRLLALTDGVVAIALTLLVLQLKVPSLPEARRRTRRPPRPPWAGPGTGWSAT